MKENEFLKSRLKITAVVIVIGLVLWYMFGIPKTPWQAIIIGIAVFVILVIFHLIKVAMKIVLYVFAALLIITTCYVFVQLDFGTEMQTMTAQVKPENSDILSLDASVFRGNLTLVGKNATQVTSFSETRVSKSPELTLTKRGETAEVHYVSAPSRVKRFRLHAARIELPRLPLELDLFTTGRLFLDLENRDIVEGEITLPFAESKLALGTIEDSLSIYSFASEINISSDKPHDVVVVGPWNEIEMEGYVPAEGLDLDDLDFGRSILYRMLPGARAFESQQKGSGGQIIVFGIWSDVRVNVE